MVRTDPFVAGVSVTSCHRSIHCEDQPLLLALVCLEALLWALRTAVVVEARRKVLKQQAEVKLGIEVEVASCPSDRTVVGQHSWGRKSPAAAVAAAAAVVGLHKGHC